MVAWAVIGETGSTLSIFRYRTQADNYLYQYADALEPIFRAKHIQKILMAENIWDQDRGIYKKHDHVWGE